MKAKIHKVKLGNNNSKNIDRKISEDFSDDDPLSDVDFSAIENGMDEEEFWARKLGLTGSKSTAGRKRLKEEFAKDGLGDDFLELFDFMDEVRDEAKSKKQKLDQGVEEDAESIAETQIAASSHGKYIPPHLRKSLTASEGSVVAKSRNSVSLLGLLNRVSEGNLDSISLEIIALLMKNKIRPADAAHALLSISCGNPHITVTLQGTFAAIACAIGVETAPSNQYSGALLAALTGGIRQDASVSENHRIATNKIRFMSVLFSLGLFSVEVIDSLLKFLEQPSQVEPEKRLEWIITCLRFSGRVLKDDHKSRLAQLVDRVLITLDMETEKSKRFAFGIKELKSMKDSKSNFRAIDHLQTACEWLTVRSASGKAASSTSGSTSTLSGWKLPKSVETVQLVSEADVFASGYKFPPSWTDRSDSAEKEFDVTDTVDSWAPAAKLPSLEELAAHNRMTTEVKRNAFIAIMGSIDSKHAALRLDKFGLMVIKNIAQIVQVVCHCALQEQSVNKFYLELIHLLCTDSRDEKRSRKFSISFKIEFSKLITSGKLSPGEIAVLSNIIASYISFTNVKMEDILRVSSDS